MWLQRGSEVVGGIDRGGQVYRGHGEEWGLEAAMDLLQVQSNDSKSQIC